MARYIKSFGLKISAFYRKHPIARGMTSYGMLWPLGCYFEQRIDGVPRDSIDWKRCLRFSIFGAFISAPSLYFWIRLTTIIWPQNTLKMSVIKTVAEQIYFEPVYLYTFFMVMALTEGESVHEANEEVKEKFWSTYFVSCCFWPIFQTLNFRYVSEGNRVVVVSLASLGWVTFLAYVKRYQSQKNDPKN